MFPGWAGVVLKFQQHTGSYGDAAAKNCKHIQHPRLPMCVIIGAKNRYKGEAEFMALWRLARLPSNASDCSERGSLILS